MLLESFNFGHKSLAPLAHRRAKRHETAQEKVTHLFVCLFCLPKNNYAREKLAIDVDIRTHYMRFVISFLKTGDAKLMQEFVVLRSPINNLLDDLRRDGIIKHFVFFFFDDNNNVFFFKKKIIIIRCDIFGRVFQRTL